jgi:hypothetical protein
VWKVISGVVVVGDECVRKAVNDIVVDGEDEGVRKALRDIVMVEINVWGKQGVILLLMMRVNR